MNPFLSKMMMIIDMGLTIIAIILLLAVIVIGLLFLFSPRILIRLERVSNKVLFSDSVLIEHNRITGSTLILISAFLLIRFFSI